MILLSTKIFNARQANHLSKLESVIKYLFFVMQMDIFVLVDGKSFSHLMTIYHLTHRTEVNEAW